METVLEFETMKLEKDRRPAWITITRERFRTPKTSWFLGNPLFDPLALANVWKMWGNNVHFMEISPIP